MCFGVAHSALWAAGERQLASLVVLGDQAAATSSGWARTSGGLLQSPLARGVRSNGWPGGNCTQLSSNTTRGPRREW